MLREGVESLADEPVDIAEQPPQRRQVHRRLLIGQPNDERIGIAAGQGLLYLPFFSPLFLPPRRPPPAPPPSPPPSPPRRAESRREGSRRGPGPARPAVLCPAVPAAAAR